MKLEEAYSALRLGKGATLEEVKKSYRALAFELHPDLNQDDPNAGARFQLVNEAYVLLKNRVPSNGGGTGSSAWAQASQNASAGSGAAASDSAWGGDRMWTSSDKDPKDRARREKAKREQAAREREAERRHKARRKQKKSGGFWASFTGADKKGASDAEYTTEAGAKRKAGHKAQQQTYQKSTYGRPKAGPKTGPTTGGQQRAQTGQPGNATSRRFYYEKEEILQDILRDPFARQVFEEIYSEIRRDGRMPKGTSSAKRKLSFEWGDRTVTVNLSRGLWGGTKYWMRRQLDDEQVIGLPATSLRPGAKVRLQITKGWSGKRVSVEVTLPPDFKQGRAIRLKGLGRSLGPWQGDLYLRLVPK